MHWRWEVVRVLALIRKERPGLQLPLQRQCQLPVFVGRQVDIKEDYAVAPQDCELVPAQQRCGANL